MGPYAGFMKRLAAFLIDIVIVSLLAGIFAGAVVGLAAVFDRIGLWPESNTGLDDILGQLVITLMLLGSAVIVWLYWAKQESSAKQATLGKQAVGILVTDLDGRRITFRRATVRHFAKLVSAFPALVGFLLMLVTKRRQTLHDMLAKPSLCHPAQRTAAPNGGCSRRAIRWPLKFKGRSTRLIPGVRRFF